MKRLVFATIMAILFFALTNFIYCNLGEEAFGHAVAFNFSIPYLATFRSAPIPLGFMLIIAFSAGMVAIALLEALPSLYKSLELRSKNKKIRQLERELSVARQLTGSQQHKE